MSKKKSSIGKKIGSSVSKQVNKKLQEASQPAYEKQLGQDMVNAMSGAAQTMAARNYNTAAAAYQNASAHGGLPTYAQLQDYFSTVSGMAQATKNAAQQGVILPRNVSELENLRRGYAGMLQQSSWAKRLLNLSEDEYNTGYLYPSKYQGANRQTINENMARLKAVGDSGKGELKWLQENQYNYWTPDEIRKGIADTKNEIDLQKSQRRNNLILQDRLDKLRTASKTAATRDWDDLTRGNMEELARLTGHRSDSMRAGAAAQAMTPGTNNPILSAMTAQDAGKNDDRIRELYDYFRKKGYKDDEIAALSEYFLQNQHAQQRMKDLQELQEWGSKNAATRALSAATSVPASLASGIGYADLAAQAIGARQDPFTGERMRIDPYSGATGIGDAANVMRGAAIEGAPEPVKLAYNALMSLADSYLAMQSGKGAVNVLLGGSAATSKARSAFEHGASDWQALAAGAAAGIAEGLFEEFSIDRLRIMQTSSATAKRTVKEFFLDWLKQGVTEGSEEGLTTLANTLTDAWIMGDKSELNTRIRELMQNMSEEAATKQAYAEWAGQLGTDVLAGFLSGSMSNVISGGMGSIERNAANFSTGQDIRKAGNMGAMIEQGLAMPEGSAAFTAAQRAQNAKEGSRRQARHVGEAYTAMQRGELRSAMQEQLEAWGAENSAETAEAVMRSIQQQTLTRRQQQLLDTNAAQRILAEYEYAQNNSVDPDHWTSRAQGRQFVRMMDAYTPRQTEPENAQNVPQSIQEYAGQYGDQAKAVQRVYELTPDADLESFAVSFDAAYEAGQQGAELEAIQNHNAMAGLEPQQVKLAWQMGKESGGRIATPAARNDNIDQNDGGNQNGAEVHLRRGSERDAGAGAGGAVRSVAQSTEPAARERETLGKRAKDGGVDALRYQAQPKVTAFLGIENGSRYGDKVYLPEDGERTEKMRSAEQTAKSVGKKIVFFAGGNLRIRSGDRFTNARGYYDHATGTIYVRIDHANYDADQIARHEAMHARIMDGEISLEKAKAAMLEGMTDEELEKAVNDYTDLYDGTDLTADEIWEEMVCDAAGDMNLFADLNERKFTEADERAQKWMPKLKEAAENAKGDGRVQTEGAKFSFDISGNGLANDALLPYDNDMRRTIETAGNVIIDSYEALSKFVEDTFGNPNAKSIAFFGNIPSTVMHDIEMDVPNLPREYNGSLFKIGRHYSLVASADNVRHMVNEHDLSRSEVIDYLNRYADTVLDRDSVSFDFHMNGKNKENGLLFKKRFPDGVLQTYEIVSNKNKKLSLWTFYPASSKQKKKSAKAPAGANTASANTSKTQGSQTSVYNISDFAGKSKPKTSRDLESLEELRRENRELRERAKKWRRETTRTKQPEVRADDVRRAAKALIRDMQSTVKAEEITDELQDLAEYMMRGEGKNERAPSWTEVKERAGAIAETLVDNAEALSENSDPELYREMKQYVRDTKMTIADRDKGDIPNGYEYFRRQNVGILRLGKDGLPVDTAYDQLRDQFGESYFPAEITHPADQLMRIADVINGLKPVYENPHTAHRAEAIEWTANAMIDTLLSEDVRQTAPTYADRAEAKLDARVAAERDRADARVAAEREKAEARRQEYMQRSHAAIERVRAQRDRQIAKVKQEHRDQKARARDRKTRSEMWRGILALKQDFQRMVDKPEKGNSRHAPMGLAVALRNVADCFDRERGRRDPNVKLPEFKETLVRLRDEYESMKDTEALSFFYDPVVMEQLAGVNQALRNVTDPAAMTTGQVAQIYDALRMCKHSITTANRFIAMEYDKGITEAGRQWGGEVMRASPLIRGIGGQLLNYQLRPDSFFARISGFAKGSVGEHVQQMFVNGTEKMLRIQQNFYYAFEKFSTDKRFDALTKRGEKALVDVGLKDMDGNTVKLTRDQMLSVFMHLRSEDNLRAAAYGGLDVPNAKAYYTGNVAQSFDNSVRTACIDASTVDLISEQRQLQKLAREDEARGEVRPEVTQRLDEIEAELQAAEGEMISTLLDVRAAIEKQLTDFEKELVAAADAWMRQSADYINAETMAMYGIEKANVDHYWAIHRNTNFVNTDMRTAADEINLENWGSLKERVRSHAPVKLTGFIFELDNHTKKMSQFCGFAAVQRDFNKLYNTRLPEQHTSLSEQVQKKFGSGEKKLGVSGQEYIDNYIKSISGGEHVKPSPIAWFRMNLPRATLSANFRVALSQVASVPTAAAEVGWGAMAKGFARYSVKGLSAKQQEQLARTDPWFWQRSRGEGGMREFAEMKESTLALDRAYNKVAGTKVGKALLNWCQRFDMYATYTQWAMAEEWVKSNRKDLEKGSDAWNEAVSHKYRDIIRKTQPNYTTTERSDLLRDSRETMKWATMYKTQSNQNLNILYDATARLRQYTRDHKAGRNGVTDADLKEARQQFARAYTGVILGGTVTFVLFRALANALMHSMNAYRDDDDELTKESVMNGLMQETLGAMTGMFLLGSEIEEIVTAAVTGGKYWGLSDSGISALSDVVEDSLNLLKKVRSGDAALQDYRKVINSFMAPLGIPGENVMKIVNGVRYHIEDIQNGEFLSFEAGVNRTAKQQGNRFVHALRDKNTALMQRIYAEMVDTSSAQDPDGATQSALRKRIKSAYLDEEDGVKLTDKQAAQLLGTYGGKTGEDAEELIRKWSFEKQYGFQYDDLKDLYLGGEIREKDYVSARVQYGGKSEEESQKELLHLKCFQDYGIEYGEKTVVEAVENGDITPEEAKSIWMEYGGIDEEKAQKRADQARFVMENPGTDYELVKNESVQDYYDYGKPANIPADTFMEYWSDMDDIHADLDASGKTVSNSRRTKIINYIDGLNISDAQKDALFLTQYAQSSLKYCTWRS